MSNFRTSMVKQIRCPNTKGKYSIPLLYNNLCTATKIVLMSTIFILSIWTPSILTILVLKFQQVYFTTPQLLYNTITGIKSKTMLAKQLCCIQTKMYRLYRKLTIMVIFLYNLYILVGNTTNKVYR